MIWSWSWWSLYFLGHLSKRGCWCFNLLKTQSCSHFHARKSISCNLVVSLSREGGRTESLQRTLPAIFHKRARMFCSFFFCSFSFRSFPFQLSAFYLFSFGFFSLLFFLFSLFLLSFFSSCLLIFPRSLSFLSFFDPLDLVSSFFGLRFRRSMSLFSYDFPWFMLEVTRDIIYLSLFISPASDSFLEYYILKNLLHFFSQLKADFEEWASFSSFVRRPVPTWAWSD